MSMTAITYGLECILTLTLLISNIDMFPINSRTNNSSIDGHTVNYLMQFGYLPQVNLEVANLQSEDIVKSALRKLQKFANIPETGLVDEATKVLLQRKRCGLPDFNFENDFGRRKKRYTLQGQYWKHSNLTWSLQTRYIRGLHSGYVRSVLSRALNVWSNHSKITFQEIASDQADINIHFLRGHHGDGYPFDGKGQILAHAFFPGTGRGGDAHFDEDETWTIDYHDNENDGTSLFLVAAHEFGHSLGLSHSNVKGALMFPFYQSTETQFELPLDDQYGIQQLYGAKEDKMWGPNLPHVPQRYIPTTTTTTTTTTRPIVVTHRRHHNDRRPYNRPSYPRYPQNRPNHPPDHSHPNRKYNVQHKRPYHPKDNEIPLIPQPNTCYTSYDAVSIIRSEVFIFKDKYLWRIGDSGLYEGYPAEIRRMFPTFSENLTHVDAVYERLDGKIVFFVGRLYYVFEGNRLDRDYPKTLVHLGLPHTLDKIDAAFIWGYNKQTYLFAGEYFWRFNEDVELVENDYPRRLDTFWKGIEPNIDAAFQWKDGSSTFQALRVETANPLYFSAYIIRRKVKEVMTFFILKSQGKTYFFKRTGFWKFNDMRNRVEKAQLMPSSSFWMGCPSNDNDIPVKKEPYVSSVSLISIRAQLISNTFILLVLAHLFFY